MKNTKSLEIKVGIVSLLATVILVFGIVFGSSLGFGSNSNILKIHFPNSSGVKKATPVTINGLESGVVDDVVPKDNGVEITVSLSSQADLREDASAIILLKEITGGKKIEITPGDSEVKFNYNNLLYGKPSSDIGDLVAVIGDVSGDAVTFLKRLDTISYSITKLLVEDKFGEKLNNSLSNLDSISEKVKIILDKNYNNINYSLENIESLSSDLKDFMKNKPEKVDTLLDNFNKLTDNINSFIESTDPTIQELKDLISNVNQVVEELKQKKGLLGKLINDEKFSEEIEKAINELGTFIEKIDKHGINVNARFGTRPKK